MWIFHCPELKISYWSAAVSTVPKVVLGDCSQESRVWQDSLTLTLQAAVWFDMTHATDGWGDAILMCITMAINH